MNSKRIFLWPVIISVIGHAVLITVSSMVDLRDNVKAAELFTVQFVQPQSTGEPKKTTKPEPEKIKEQTKEETKEETPLPEGGREETVNIGSSDVKYADYLQSIKRQIMRIWKYPAGASEKNEEGIVVVKMSIDADGALSGAVILTSSGSNNLDAGTLEVVRAAAPFRPLPGQYDLSRLHIIASFRYRMND